MITIKLTNQQFNYLKSHLLKSYGDLYLDQKVDKKNGTVLIYIDPANMDTIRDWAGGELQRAGFDKSYELTNEGKILEELIELFYLRPEDIDKNN